MTVEDIKRDLEQVRHPVSSSLSLPPRCYYDARWLQHEYDKVFGNSWVGIGRQDQWQMPGDYMALQLGNTPLVVVMDNNGELQALSNVCLHRSSQIMEGSGNCKAMVCPFHGWSYDYTGKVISAPRMETAESFDEKLLALSKFAVTVQAGFVFVNLSEHPEPLEDWLGDFSELHECWSLTDLVVGRQRSMEVNCNWKLFMEVFNEYYHLPYVHPDSIGHYYPEPDSSDPVMGEYTTQFGETTANPALLEQHQGHSLPMIKTLGEREKRGTRYTWVYPNLTFAASFDCLWMYHVYPISANRTKAVQTVCFPRESTLLDKFKETADIYYSRFDFAINEDIPALERQQTGMESPHASQGRFSTLEPSVGNFACWYSELTRS